MLTTGRRIAGDPDGIAGPDEIRAQAPATERCRSLPFQVPDLFRARFAHATKTQSDVRVCPGDGHDFAFPFFDNTEVVLRIGVMPENSKRGHNGRQESDRPIQFRSLSHRGQ